MSDDREAQEEQAASAVRSRDPRGRFSSSAAWHDLDPAGRRRAYEAAVQWRRIEAALDPDGLSAAARSVLRHLGPQLDGDGSGR